jgi:hypothetical protein
MHTHESTLYTQHVSCIHTSVAAPFRGGRAGDLGDRALTCGQCRTSQLQSARWQPTIVNESLPLEVDSVLICGIPLPKVAIRQRSTCLQGTGSTESVPHTVTHSHTSGTSKVVHSLVVASTSSWSIACVSDAYDYTHLQFGHKQERKDAKRYTYQTQTVKPVFMSDSIVSLTELIAAGHCVAVPHVAVERGEQALCGIQYDKSHGSLIETHGASSTGNTIDRYDTWCILNWKHYRQVHPQLETLSTDKTQAHAHTRVNALHTTCVLHTYS